MGMIERRNSPRLALESPAEFLPGGLDGHFAAKARIDGCENGSHAALTEAKLLPEPSGGTGNSPKHGCSGS